MTTAPAEPPAPARGSWPGVVALTGAAYLAVVNTSLPAVASTHVAGGLGAAAPDGLWAVAAYMTGFAAAAPLAARLADRFGPRRACLGGLAVFALGAAAAGLSGSLLPLIVARSVQGAAGGLLVPVAQRLVGEVAPARRAAALGAFALAVLAGPATGPAVGGWIADRYSWRWLFLWDVVPTAACLAVLARRLPASPPSPTVSGRFDWLGAALLVAGLGCLEVVLVKGEEWGWGGSRAATALAAAAGVSLSWAAARCLDRPDPVVRLRLLADRRLLVATVLAAAASAAYLGALSTVSKMLQGQLGYAAGTVGGLAGPAALLLLLAAPAVLWAAGRSDARPAAVAGLLVLAAGCGWLARANLAAEPGQVFWARAAMVLGAGLAVAAPTAASQGLPARDRGDAAVLFSLIRNLGSTLGVCLAAVVATRRGQVHTLRLTEDRLHALNPDVTGYLRAAADRFLLTAAGGDAAAADLLALKGLDALRGTQALSLAYFDCFWLAAAAAAGLVPVALLLRKRPSRSAGPDPTPERHVAVDRREP